MMVCSWLSYVDRQILATLSVVILADTGLSTERYTEVVSAFSIAYMIGNPLWGSLLDYIGLRKGMLAAVAIWSAASLSHSFVGQGTAAFLGLAAARALLGFGEGATFPGGFRTAMDSLPPNRQARGIAISYSGGSLGAIVTPFLVIPIAGLFGWRAAFLVTGTLGFAWLALWAKVARPPYLRLPERKPAKIIWPNLLERRFWALVCGYSLGAFALGPILYLSSLYLNRVFGVSQDDLKYYLWVPPAGWEAGYFFWGWAADRYASGEPSSGAVCAADDPAIAAGGGDVDCVTRARHDRFLLVDVRGGGIHRRRAACRLAGVSGWAEFDGGGARGGDVVGAGRCVAAAVGAMVRPAALYPNVLAGDAGPSAGNGDVALAN